MSDGSYLVRLHSLQRKTNMINKTLQKMASEITVLKYESYQNYYRKHERHYEWQDPSIKKKSSISPNKRSRQPVPRRRISEPDSSKKTSERRSTRIANNPKIKLNETVEDRSDSEGLRLSISELTGSLVRPIQHPIRNSNWTLADVDDKYESDSLPDTEEFGFIPLSLKTLLQTKQMKQILQSFDGL
ncbi:hypothetical protein, no similarity [Maudiozyma saulgeensis]|uniref:Uncharacterized protein n=1 Tax=Maudiozyma saulgeensis TaxID=1789683 RepID=A0A1X7R912_9SACH|nr:hypothetical protein, no similarity [Kazachstania saulgeensis]